MPETGTRPQGKRLGVKGFYTDLGDVTADELETLREQMNHHLDDVSVAHIEERGGRIFVTTDSHVVDRGAVNEIEIQLQQFKSGLLGLNRPFERAEVIVRD